MKIPRNSACNFRDFFRAILPALLIILPLCKVVYSRLEIAVNRSWKIVHELYQAFGSTMRHTIMHFVARLNYSVFDILNISPRSCQALSRSSKILQRACKIFQDLPKNFQVLARSWKKFMIESKILSRYSRRNSRFYQKIQDRLQEHICRTCSSSASNAFRN